MLPKSRGGNTSNLRFVERKTWPDYPDRAPVCCVIPGGTLNLGQDALGNFSRDRSCKKSDQVSGILKSICCLLASPTTGSMKDELHVRSIAGPVNI